MKAFLFIFFSFFTMLSIGQISLSTTVEKDSLSNQAKVKKSRYIIFPGCEAEEDKYECYANKLQDFIVNNMSVKAKEHLSLFAENDTIVLFANIKYDKLGNKKLNESRLKGFVDDFDQFLIPIKNSLPKVEPALDYKGNPKSISSALTLGFLVNKKDVLVLPLYGYQPDLERKQLNLLKVVEKFPIHPNCNEDADSKTLKECLSYNIAHFISNNFSNKLISKANLPDGKYTIYASFKIDRKGKVIDIETKGPNKIIEEEAKRILKLLPNFKPGSLRGKPLTFPFSLPIAFEVNNKTRG